MRLEFEPNVTIMPLVTSDEVFVSPAPDLQAVLKDGIAAAKNGEREAARELLMEATEIDPRNEDAWMWLASINDYPEELIAFLTNVLTINPKNDRAVKWMAETRSLLAKTFVERGADANQHGAGELAMQCVDQAILHDDQNESAWSLKADISRSDDQKVECLKRVLEINPKNKEARTALTKMAKARAKTAVAKAKAATGTRKRKKAAVKNLQPVLSAAGPDESSLNVQVDHSAELPTPTARHDSVICPFCSGENEANTFECTSCHAALSLSDIEALLSNANADRDSIQRSVTKREAEWNTREFDERELTTLGIGHLNLRNFDRGLKYLRESLHRDPNNVILAGQLNTIAIRLDEMRRQDEVREARPLGKTILIVDDSPTVRKLIGGKLEKSGHNVVYAVDGVEGLAKVSEGLPDLVLLDIAMPRMDGYEVCKGIRANPAAKDVPVVMISGKGGFFDKVRGRMAGATGYVTKPFGPEALMKALETYLVSEAGPGQ